VEVTEGIQTVNLTVVSRVTIIALVILPNPTMIITIITEIATTNNNRHAIGAIYATHKNAIPNLIASQVVTLMPGLRPDALMIVHRSQMMTALTSL